MPRGDRSDRELQRAVGGRLRGLRLARALTCLELGRMLGVSHVTVSNYEQGRNGIPMRQLVELSKLFGVTVDWLLGLSSGG
jgi:transcriptional regulator with XRE-family HTH domain